MALHDAPKTNGAAAAALLAAGIGSFILGLLTVLKENIKAVGNALNFYNPVGSLSGATTVAVVLWICIWIILHLLLRGKEFKFGGVTLIALILIGLSLVATFPPFFDMFH
jgi:hypothetical protein